MLHKKIALADMHLAFEELKVESLQSDIMARYWSEKSHDLFKVMSGSLNLVTFTNIDIAMLTNSKYQHELSLTNKDLCSAFGYLCGYSDEYNDHFKEQFEYVSGFFVTAWMKAAFCLSYDDVTLYGQRFFASLNLDYGEIFKAPVADIDMKSVGVKYEHEQK